ncbi:MAG: T9SS type A sorting domain-containing protein [Candidatus Hatepunaea meridiana]|nr:T9SS type A sorting domain-containing protein [Candidatus Hatepunaea meridiana]
MRTKFRFILIFLFLTTSCSLFGQESSGVRLLGSIIGEWDDVCDVSYQYDYVFLATGSTGLQIVDVSDPEDLEIVGSCDTHGDAKGITVVGDFAYVAAYRAGLIIIDVSNPEEPEEVGSCDTPGRAYSVDVWGDFAYVADALSGLRKIDITEPENPEEPERYGFCDTPGEARDVAILGVYAYVADYGAGIRRICLYLMSEDGYLITQHLVIGVAAMGDYVYVANGAGGLRIVRRMSESGFFDTRGNTSGLAVSGRYVYVADGEEGLRVINTSEPENPLEVGFYDTPGEAKRVAVYGNTVYVADGNNLGIYDVSGALDVSDDFSYIKPENFKLFTAYPNPFNTQTIIPFSLPNAMPTKLEVLDLNGRRVALLMNETLNAGDYRVAFNAKEIISGIYLYRLTAGSVIQTRKIVYIK